jgi:hypothetical protein
VRDLAIAKQHPSVGADLQSLRTVPTAGEVWSALQRVGKSLGRAEKLVRLLDFLVESTLYGDASHLKETTIGVSVFGRPPDYDPKADTIVRSQVWRLRGKLDKYYATVGAHDPVVINIPKGQYVAKFSLRTLGPLPAAISPESQS